jgi:hypothetical protein
MAIVTAAQVRLHLPGITGTAEDTSLDTVISRADALMAAWIGLPRNDAGAYTLEDSTYTVYVDRPDPWDVSVLTLPVRPVVSVTSAYSDPTRVFGSAALLAGTEYDLDKTGGRLLLTSTASHAWSTGTRANKITVVAGLTAATLDLEQIVIAEVKHLWDLRRVQGPTLISGAGSSESSTPDRQNLISPVVREALAPWVMWERQCSGAPS